MTTSGHFSSTLVSAFHTVIFRYRTACQQNFAPKDDHSVLPSLVCPLYSREYFLGAFQQEGKVSNRTNGGSCPFCLQQYLFCLQWYLFAFNNIFLPAMISFCLQQYFFACNNIFLPAKISAHMCNNISREQKQYLLICGTMPFCWDHKKHSILCLLQTTE